MLLNCLTVLQGLRLAHQKARSPALPHLAIFIKDFTQLEESPTLLQSGQVNVFKMKKVGSLLWDLLRHRCVSFEWYSVPELVSWIVDSPILSEKEAYERSKKADPVGSKK
jgi:hypothetical protein